MQTAPLSDRESVASSQAAVVPARLNSTRIAWFLVAAAGYLLGAKIGFVLTLPPQPTSTLWPPNAILLAALLLTPRTHWWLLIAVVFPAHLLAELADHVPLYMVLSWFLTNVFEALLAALPIYYLVGGTPNFARRRDVSIFLLFGVGFAPFFSSYVDIAAVKMLQWGDGDYWLLWRGRFFSNALSMLIIVPAIITTARRQSFNTSLKVSWRRLEGAALMAVTVALCMVFFTDVGIDHKISSVMMSALLPLLLWAATRFGPGYVSYLILIVTSFVIWGAEQWRGPLIANSNIENVLTLQLFLIFTATPILFLTAVICEWRRAEAAASNSKQQLNLALNAAQMDTWSWDLSSNFLHWSGISPSITGEYADTINLPQFIRRIHADDRAAVERALKNAVDNGAPYELEFRLRHDDSTAYTWTASRGTALLDSAGKAYCILGVNVDISKRRQEAVLLQRQRNELSHLSRVAMLGEMSGAIAHELNQPLTAILCNAQAAQRMLKRVFPQQTGIDDILADIVSENKRAGEIILRMRELLKKGEVNNQPVDINDIVRKVIVLEHSDLISRNIALATDLQAQLPLACADSVQIQQVLLNLIINGCDAMRANVTNQRLLSI
ncbi:MAG TPA: MASE1 domain-containing protein, partial [Spongiibacteraceae bacterium]|nr:MASE1 domain-containing protein [Spongiibacteraceae bacterium]